MSDWEGVRLHVVSGKGGTGKTTVAAALALALASGGGRVLLVEVEGRQGIAQLFDTPPLPYEERRVAVAPQGGEVLALAVDTREAMLEYLDMYYHLGRAGKALERIGAVEFATTVAPGLRDVLLTGKTYEAVRRTRHGAPVYDAVVLDAPPTGRITRFLNINTEVAGIARVGPINRHAGSIVRLVTSPETVVHLTTTLEEMPVQETADAIAELGAAHLPVGAVVVNHVQRSSLDRTSLLAARRRRLEPAGVAAGLAAAGLPADPPVVEGLLTELGEHAERVWHEQRMRREVTALERPVYELPHLTDGIDLGALYELSRELRAQGAA